MSTRCQILFQEIHHGKDEKTGKEVETKWEAQIYRHSDGYPEGGVLDDLERFFKWNSDRNTDVSYTAANFIYFMKKGMEKYSEKDYMTEEGSRYLKIGYGVEKADHHIHGDEEYLYRITVFDDRKPDFKGWRIEVADTSKRNTTFDNAKYYVTYELTEEKGLNKILKNVVKN